MLASDGVHVCALKVHYKVISMNSVPVGKLLLVRA